jgi:hypothetical protein
MKRLLKKVITPVTNLIRKVGIGNRRDWSRPSSRTELGGEEFTNLKTYQRNPELRKPRQREGKRRLRKAEARRRKNPEP